MSHRLVLAVLAAAGSAQSALAQVQPHAGMLRYPDVGKTQIAFVYAGDVWLAPRPGGRATRLTTAPRPQAPPPPAGSPPPASAPMPRPSPSSAPATAPAPCPPFPPRAV